MKLLLILCLDDLATDLKALLKHHGVTAYTQLPSAGHRLAPAAVNTLGWFGHNTYTAASLLTLVFTDDTIATDVLNGIEAYNQTRDGQHPLHALQLPIERTVPIV